MTEDTVKLTVRLPAQLHRVLKERALEYNVSLNQVHGGYVGRRVGTETACGNRDEKIRPGASAASGSDQLDGSVY